MQITNVKKEKVWVVFMPHEFDEGKTLFQKLFIWFLNHFKKNFSHVAIFKKSKFSGYIEFNCCSNNFMINEISDKDFFHIIAAPEITAMLIEVKEGIVKAKGLITCVSTTKHYLGICDKPFIITPYQLFKYLEKIHGKQKS